MKYLLILLICGSLFTGCKRENSDGNEKYGTVRQQIRCASEQPVTNGKSAKNTQELKYTQFGDFIMSITPKSFIGEMEVVRYYAEDDFGSFMTLVHREPNMGEEVVLADFSNNSVLSVIPTLNGRNLINNPDGQGGYFKDNVSFKVLWIRMGLKQIIELPEEYSQVNLNQFNSNEKDQNLITTDIIPFFQAVEELSTIGRAFTIYFGMTDHTYIAVDESERHFLGNNTLPHIRSSEYSEWTMTPPLPDQTKTIVSTIGFYNSDIVQLYAGADNIPYTSDDKLVLEPKFWERIYVKVNEN